MFSQENPEKKKKNGNLWLFDALAEVSGEMLWGSVNGIGLGEFFDFFVGEINYASQRINNNHEWFKKMEVHKSYGKNIFESFMGELGSFLFLKLFAVIIHFLKTIFNAFTIKFTLDIIWDLYWSDSEQHPLLPLFLLFCLLFTKKYNFPPPLLPSLKNVLCELILYVLSTRIYDRWFYIFFNYFEVIANSKKSTGRATCATQRLNKCISEHTQSCATTH